MTSDLQVGGHVPLITEVRAQAVRLHLHPPHDPLRGYGLAAVGGCGWCRTGGFLAASSAAATCSCEMSSSFSAITRRDRTASSLSSAIVVDFVSHSCISLAVVILRESRSCVMSSSCRKSLSFSRFRRTLSLLNFSSSAIRSRVMISWAKWRASICRPFA